MTGRGELPLRRRFHWRETADVVRAAAARAPLSVDRGRLRGEDAAAGVSILVRPPLLIAPAEEVSTADEYLAALPEEPGRVALILLQAGAAALGYFSGDDMLRHATVRKYVVRGRGKAQPAWARRKGKSRYGSRLRLRGARELLEEVNERLATWWREEGEPDRLFTSVPQRAWGELLRCRVEPPFDRDVARTKIPLDLDRPTHAEMLRAWNALGHGVIEERSLDDEAGGADRASGAGASDARR